jgi:hypothetical protein
MLLVFTIQDFGMVSGVNSFATSRRHTWRMAGFLASGT